MSSVSDQRCSPYKKTYMGTARRCPVAYIHRKYKVLSITKGALSCGGSTFDKCSSLPEPTTPLILTPPSSKSAAQDYFKLKHFNLE